MGRHIYIYIYVAVPWSVWGRPLFHPKQFRLPSQKAVFQPPAHVPYTLRNRSCPVEEYEAGRDDTWGAGRKEPRTDSDVVRLNECCV